MMSPIEFYLPGTYPPGTWHHKIYKHKFQGESKFGKSTGRVSGSISLRRLPEFLGFFRLFRFILTNVARKRKKGKKETEETS